MAFQTPQASAREQQQAPINLLFTPQLRSGGEGGKGTPVLGSGHLGRSPSNTSGFSLSRAFSKSDNPPSSSRRRSMTPSSLKDTPPPPPGDSLLDSPGAAGPSLAAWAAPSHAGGDAGGPEDMMVSPTAPPSAPTTQHAAPSVPRHTRPFQEYEDTWVTVFGFGQNDVSLVLRELGKCGDIVHFGTFGDGPNVNWMHIKYSNKHGAQRALLRNGDQLSASCMVGVKPTEASKKQALEDELSSRNSNGNARSQQNMLTMNVPKPASTRAYQLDASAAQTTAIVASKSAWDKVSEFVLGL